MAARAGGKAKSPTAKAVRGKATKTKHEKKEGPKRPMSAYMFFTCERRSAIVQKQPELRSKPTQVSKLIGAEWKELTADAKAKYTKLAEGDKKRYEKEKEAAS